MSRCYDLSITATVKDRKTANRLDKVVMNFTGGKKGSVYDHTKGRLKVFWGGSFSQCGGHDDEDYNKELLCSIRKAKIKCKLNIQWTYMEDLPYEEYDFTT